MRLVAGVYQIRLPFPQNITCYTNVYVIEGEKGNILVDSGWDWPGALWAFREGMRIDSLKFQDINWIVITHIHPDHYGLAGKLKDLCGARITMHRLEAELIDSRYETSAVLLNKLSEELNKNGVAYCQKEVGFTPDLVIPMAFLKDEKLSVEVITGRLANAYMLRKS